MGKVRKTLGHHILFTDFTQTEKKMPKCHPQCGSHTPVSRFSAQTLSYLLHNDAASETGTDLKTVLFVFCLRCICDILAIFSIALVIGRIASRYLCMFFLV